MQLAIPCPHCKAEPIRVAKKVWFLYGFLIFARYGSKAVIGCRSCVQNQVLSNFGMVTLGGWWCIPWGLGTPFVMLQNLIALVSGRGDEDALGESLAAMGIPYEQLIIGDDGMTPYQRGVREALLSIITEAVWLDDQVDPRELEVAVALFGEITGEVVTPEVARGIGQRLHPRQSAPFDGFDVDDRSRLMVLNAAVAIVAGGDEVTGAQRAFLDDLCIRLGFPIEVVAELYQAFRIDRVAEARS
ncbi:MAG: hypothetical protein KDB18_11285 [Salinibacterium sp.]|nr:hypothetical protein [Planctomycetota bacterium]MCB1282093.1 hypothetical protein [Salinibacterium sp.]